MKKISAFTLVIILAISVTSCSISFSSSFGSSSDNESKIGEVSYTNGRSLEQHTNFESFYNQKIFWDKCQPNECAIIKAPLDWTDPTNTKSVNVILNIKRATGDKIGSLIINPGGPGASGVEFLDSAYSMLDKEIRGAYDMVGFDPRGIKRANIVGSTPIICWDDDKQKHDDLLESSPQLPEDIESVKASTIELNKRCIEKTGESILYFNTQQTARDIELIHSLLGDNKLNYLGMSYGTDLGSIFAGLFPEKVGKMVLDGAIDPTMTTNETSLSQAKGFELALTNYLQDCVDTVASCPFSSVDNGKDVIKKLFSTLRERPMDGKEPQSVNDSVIFYGIINALYSRANWAYSTKAFTEIQLDHTATTFEKLANDYFGYRDNKFTDNLMDANFIISCNDDLGNPNLEEQNENAARIVQEAPTLGRFWTYGGFSCLGLEESKGKIEFDITAPDANPILVIGTTGDPATPYEEAEALADILSSGTLLTYDGEGHTSLLAGSACIDTEIRKYFLDKKYKPKEGMRCS